MANYYTEGSAVVPLTSKQCETCLRIIEMIEDETINLVSKYINALTREKYNKDNILLARQWARRNQDIYCCNSVGFDAEMTSDGLWVHNRDQLDIESLASFIQIVFRHYKLDDGFGFEVGHTCDRSRVDGFGGTAVFITKSNISWFSTYGWLDEKELRHAGRLNRKGMKKHG